MNLNLSHYACQSHSMLQQRKNIVNLKHHLPKTLQPNKRIAITSLQQFTHETKIKFFFLRIFNKKKNKSRKAIRRELKYNLQMLNSYSSPSPFFSYPQFETRNSTQVHIPQ
ncbi:hypothetical protein AAHE18_14G189100 [Arachis hypogaea]